MNLHLWREFRKAQSRVPGLPTVVALPIFLGGAIVGDIAGRVLNGAEYAADGLLRTRLPAGTFAGSPASVEQPQDLPAAA